MDDTPISILFEGWLHFPHSYAIVNVYQLLALSRFPGVTLYIDEKPPYRDTWKVCASLEHLMLTSEENHELDAIPKWDGTQHVDVVWRSMFPYDCSPFGDTPVAVQFTAEFGVLLPDYIKAPFTPLDMQCRCAQKLLLATTPSAWNVPALGNDGGRDSCVIVPHGCDTAKYFYDAEGRKKMRTSLNIPDKDYVYLNLGAMTGNKNIFALITAFALILKDNPKAPIWLLLKGMDALYNSHDLVNSAASCSVASGLITREFWLEVVSKRLVYLSGVFPYETMRHLYSAVDCYVTPYGAEGFNLPALEAEACGLPVIATTGGPTDDFLHPSVHIPLASEVADVQQNGGKLLRVQPITVKEAMVRAFEEREERARICRDIGPGYVESAFSWKNAATQLLRGLKSFINK